jgi:subtilase family serine protease
MMHRQSIRASITFATALVFATCALGATAQSFAATESIKPLVPDRGRVTSSQEQTVTVYLNLHDQAGFDREVANLYDPASPTFHRWLTDADLARYAPTEAEVQTVKAELTRQGLTIISADPNNFSVRARAPVSTIEAAFGTELHTFSYKGANFQAPVRPAQLAGQAGALVAATVGLERHAAHPQFTIARDPLTGKPLFEQEITATQTASGILKHITGTALTGPQTFTLKALAIPLPYATYYGPAYGINFLEHVSYSPAQLQAHYGLKPLLDLGYDGRGQTIALLEAYGYAEAEADANVVAELFGLPALNSKNFSVVYPEGKPLNPNAADLAGWTPEIALDIQSAHAIAPGAKLVVVASAGQDDEDQIASLEYIIRHKLANIVSASWENDAEIIAGADQMKAFNNVLERAAAAGISVQFASGDSGDQGLGSPLGAVLVPGNSPYATAVGGTSVLNDPLRSGDLEGSGDIVTGWGSNFSLLQNYFVSDPPGFDGFQFGAGGGESLYFPKPSWQSALKGSGRQVPDVSADADPFTGVPVIVTTGGAQLLIAEVGGTSLATPIFSAIWAIADQYNGAPLGFAAPAVARLKNGEITDVVDTSDLSVDSLSGTVFDQSGSTFYNTEAIFSGAIPAIAQTNYLAAITPAAQISGGIHSAFAVTFGADTSLTVETGWDNVTGFGEPNGFPFIIGVSVKKK